MIRDGWGRIRPGGAPAIAGFVLALLAGVGDVLVLAGVGVAMPGGRAPRVLPALLSLIAILTSLGGWIVRQPALDGPDLTRADRWFPLVVGLSQAGIVAWLLLSPW